ncbi:MAG: hypothetical protein WCS37_21530 [Chloroflexota bacterium]|nr:hypothetical protein [Chloroflexota bacterium]
MRRIGLYIALVIIYLSGALVLLDFFTKGLVDNAAALLSLWVTFITGFALLLGLTNIMRVHLKRISQGGSDRIYSVALISSAVVVIGAGLFGRVTGRQDDVTNWLFQYIYQPLSATFFSLLAFLMMIAAIRVLRIGTVESTLLLVGAVIVLLGQATISPLNNFAALSQWFQDYPVQGAIRGIVIGSALGAIATSLRYLLGVDNQYLR